MKYSKFFGRTKHESPHDANSTNAELLTKAGFQTICLETPGKLDVEIVLGKKNKGYPVNEKNKYIDFLLEQSEETLDNFQKFLSKNRLSSHMLIIGKK